MMNDRMGLSLPFFFPLSKGKFSGIAQWIWQVIPTFLVGFFLASVAFLAVIILGVLAPLDVSFMLEVVAFLAAFFFGILEFLLAEDFLSAFVDFFFELLALLAVVGFLASVVLGALASEASVLIGELAF